MSDGNIAAMRAALEEIDRNTDLLDIAEGVAPNLHPSRSFVAVQIRKIVRAALAAPPRNCDRFQTASEVSAYWNSNVRTVPLPHDAYGMHIDGETYPTFLDWLMAPAKEGK